MNPFNPVPSVEGEIPANLEHHEAKQAAVNKERADYIKSLTPEEQIRFAAVENAAATLKVAGVPFYLWAGPEDFSKIPFPMWLYQHETNQPLYTDAAQRERGLVWTSFLDQCMLNLVRSSKLGVILYNKDNGQRVGHWE